MIKKLFATILILFLLAFPVSAANTHSIDLENSASEDQSLSITDGDQTGLDLSGDFTLEARVEFETITHPNTDNPVILGRWAVNQYAWYFQYTKDYGSGNVLRLGISDDGVGANTEYLEKAWSPNNDRWYHIAVTFDASASTAEFFIDTSSIGTDTGTITSIFDGSAVMYIGIYLGTGNGLDGKMDDIRVWSDIRTDQEIIDNYNCQLAGDEDNLVAYWQLNNGLLDETTNDNDLTNNNSALYSTDIPFVGECGAVAVEVKPVQTPIKFE